MNCRPCSHAASNTTFDGRNEYWYDAEGRLCAAQDMTMGLITQYVYDAGGVRILKGTVSGSPAASNTSTCTPFNLTINTGDRTYSFATENQYLVGLGGEQVTEFDGWGDWLHSNVWLGGKLLASYDAFGPALHFDLTDPLGTKRVQANVAGQWDEACISLPFGNDVGNPDMVTCNYNQDPTSDTLNTWSDATEHHFTAKERDTESGNDYFLARYYSSTFGRFLSPDWSVKVEPVPYAKLGDPQTLNLYAYVGNNPIIHDDPDGHATENWREYENRQWIVDHQMTELDGGLAKSAGIGPDGAQQQFGRQSDGSYKAPTGPGSDIYARLHGGKNEFIGNGECVSATAQFSGVTANTKDWESGRHAMSLTDRDIGLAVATFESSGPTDSNGHYPRGHDKNSGIFMGSGWGGIWVFEQWPARPDRKARRPFLRLISSYDANNTRHPSRSDNADAYYVIIVPR